MIVRGLFLGILAAVAVAGTAAQGFDLSQARAHVAFNIGSHHLNASRQFEEFNPGLGVGVTVPTAGGEAGFELGQYRNSLGADSHYAMAHIDWQVASAGADIALRLGGFGGMARYPGDAAKFKNRGVPTVGNWVMAAGVQATVRIADTIDLRMRAMPAGNVADALFTAQVAYRF